MNTVINFKYRYVFFGLLLMAAFSCSRSKFSLMNTDPDAVLTIEPATELTPGEIDIHSNDFEVFYDFVRNIKPWTQNYVPTIGNSAIFQTSGGNINNRWGNFYGGVGYNLEDVLHIVDKMPDAKRAQYQFLRAIATIPLIYYAFFTSDPNGSIPYTQAFQARYTIPPLLTPVYDTQESLFDTLDMQLKAAVTELESSPGVTQVLPGNNEIYFQGDPVHWIKAANSLRLKIAMRLMKRNPAKLTSIANEVLNEQVGLISSVEDDWVFYASAISNIGNGGNSNPFNQGFYSGARNTVNFMYNAKDPRTRIFYQPSGITSQAMFDSAQVQGKIPGSVTWDGQLYRGQYASPAATQDPAKSFYFTPVIFSFNGQPQSVNYTSLIQPRLVYAAYNSGGGANMFPVITYADVCLMRAELVQRGLSSDPMTAEDLYYAGITASITNYDNWGKITQLEDYTSLGPSEISTYLSQPGVIWDPANALEQICIQEYLNYFTNPNETWAVIKRTGFPNPAGQIMPMEDVSAYGPMPRRYAVSYPSAGDLNFANVTKAIDGMRADPNFGDPSDMTGRVWWDQP